MAIETADMAVTASSSTTPQESLAIGRAAERKRQATLQPRIESAKYVGMEYSAHLAPRRMARDLGHVFPDAPKTDIIIVPTLQRAAMPLLEFGNEQEVEKDRCMHVFFTWARRVRSAILAREPDAWCDVTDPATGRAHFGTPAAGYSDVDGLTKIDTFPTEVVGGCRVMKHPTWAFAVYPATLFTTASWSTLNSVLTEVNADLNTAMKGLISNRSGSYTPS